VSRYLASALRSNKLCVGFYFNHVLTRTGGIHGKDVASETYNFFKWLSKAITSALSPSLLEKSTSSEQGHSQTFLITEAIAKEPKVLALRGSGGTLLQKNLKSKRSEMPFLAFSWWHFPSSIIKIQTNLTAFMSNISSPLKNSRVSFRNEILKALKCYFSMQEEKNINLRAANNFSFLNMSDKVPILVGQNRNVVGRFFFLSVSLSETIISYH